MPERVKQIKEWLENDLQADIKTFEPASKDASFRRYFRIVFNHVLNPPPNLPPIEQGGGTFLPSFIIMDAPPEKENTEPFIRIAALLKRSGINGGNLHQKLWKNNA
ncbi:MAG: hypothetical protein ABFS32_22545 [Bacteroidota bacterium]